MCLCRLGYRASDARFYPIAGYLSASALSWAAISSHAGTYRSPNTRTFLIIVLSQYTRHRLLKPGRNGW